MLIRSIVFMISVCLWMPALSALAHGIYHRVDEKGISVRFFYAQNDPASYSSYEIFAPDETIPHKTGRTDKNGFVSFLPDKAGTWTVKVSGESDHGIHGKTINVEVNEGLFVESYQKPFVAEYINIFMGLSIILFLYSLWVQFSRGLRIRKKNETDNHSKS